MRILDIDLDFFLNNIAQDRSSNSARLSEDEFHPWTQQATQEFLEDRCGLSTTRRIPGRYVIHHHEAFHWWRKLVTEGTLNTPFEVVHVDAHADLGSGTFGYSSVYVCLDLLHQPLERRENPVEDGRHMNAGNYLVVAIACRWLHKLVYVTHPQNRLEDCEKWLFSAYDEKSWTIALPKCQEPTVVIPGVTPTVLEREPAVEFIPTTGKSFHDDGTFDFMILCQSPGFTPASSDLLIPVIQEYMNLTP